MKTPHAPLADPMKILTRAEMAAVLADLARKAPCSKNTRQNRAIFRIAACCGLRASEIAGLGIADVCDELPRPHLRIRASAAKGSRPRVVPLWWDAGTHADLAAWKAEISDTKAAPNDAYVASLRHGRIGAPLSRFTILKRFRNACKVLGPKRLESLTIHDGRHTFISHALAGGRTLAEVRDAAGHANISVTSEYLHVAVEDQELGSLFGRQSLQKETSR